MDGYWWREENASTSEIYTVWFKIIFDEFIIFWKIIKFNSILTLILI
jgi:hypothetical protein